MGLLEGNSVIIANPPYLQAFSPIITNLPGNRL